MAEASERFENGECFVPEMLITTRALKQGLSVPKPRLEQFELASQVKVVIGKVKDDPHGIGKDLLSMMLDDTESELFDLGPMFP